MSGKEVKVGIWHGDDRYMTQVTENDILPENIPKTARLLMDMLYLRLDDHVSAAQLRAHRRQQRDNRRKRSVRKVETQAVEEAGE